MLVPFGVAKHGVQGGERRRPWSRWAAGTGWCPGPRASTLTEATPLSSVAVPARSRCSTWPPVIVPVGVIKPLGGASPGI